MRDLRSQSAGDGAESPDMTTEFHRIRRLPPYVFEEVNRIKAKLRAEGTDIIDFGMGNPDMPTPKHIVDKLIETARDPKAGRYSASKGIIGLRRAMAGYYDRRYGVKLNPDTEVIATLGSKEGFANLAQALTAPGDTVIVSVNVVEGNRKRVQAYEGVVIGRRNRGLNSSFVVRKVSEIEKLKNAPHPAHPPPAPATPRPAPATTSSGLWAPR